MLGYTSDKMNLLETSKTIEIESSKGREYMCGWKNVARHEAKGRSSIEVYMN